MSNEINFDALESIRQANTRTSSHHLTRKGDGRFIITNDARSLMGLNALSGVDLKAGNGHVLFGIRLKDDPKCTRGLLNGSIGKGFTSTRLEDAIKANKIESNLYKVEFVQVYDDASFYKLVPIEGKASDTDDAEEAVAASTAPVAEAPVAEAIPETSAPVVDSAKTNDEF